MRSLYLLQTTEQFPFYIHVLRLTNAHKILGNNLGTVGEGNRSSSRWDLFLGSALPLPAGTGVQAEEGCSGISLQQHRDN